MTTELQLHKIETVLLAVIVAVAIAVSAFFYVQTQRAVEAYICDSKPITVNEGDTLYRLVRANCDGNLQEALNDAVDIYGTIIGVGQTVFLPQSNNCSMRLTDGGEAVEDC